LEQGRQIKANLKIGHQKSSRKDLAFVSLPFLFAGQLPILGLPYVNMTSHHHSKDANYQHAKIYAMGFYFHFQFDIHPNL
jgi:hypothetical protein